jgi:hypothetical protein
MVSQESRQVGTVAGKMLVISTQRLERDKLRIGGVHRAETRPIGFVFAL